MLLVVGHKNLLESVRGDAERKLHGQLEAIEQLPLHGKNVHPSDHALEDEDPTAPVDRQSPGMLDDALSKFLQQQSRG